MELSQDNKHFCAVQDLGNGRIGPNVLFIGQLNYHFYCDQIASWLYDRYFEKAKSNGNFY